MKAKTLGSYLGICKQSEVLILATIGIFYTIFDASLLNLWPDLQRIWTVLMDPMKMPIIMHLYIRYILSGVVIAQAFTLHIYLASYVILMYPACTMERPQLILPWLFIGTVKTMLLCTVTFTTGLYVCLMYRFMRPACWDFLLTQVVTHGPSFYMWGLILSYYRDLRKIEKITSDLEVKSLCTFDISTRRKKAKSLAISSYDASSYAYDDNRPFISASTIENMVLHLGWVGKRNTIMSRSLDTLVGEMEIEADRQLLLGTETEESFATDEKMSVEEKTLQLLQVSPMEIIRAKRERKIIRQIVATSRMTVKSTLAFRSLVDTTCIAQVLSTNLKSIENQTSVFITTVKPSCESETEICVHDLNSPDYLVKAVIESETIEILKKPMETQITKQIEIVFSASGATKRFLKNALIEKKNASYNNCLNRKCKKNIIRIAPTVPVDKTEIQEQKRCSYKYDGYTEAYLRKKKYEEETARKIRMKNLK